MARPVQLSMALDTVTGFQLRKPATISLCSSPRSIPAPTRWVDTLAVILSIVMVAGGSLKLLRLEFVVGQFQSWSLPIWFITLVGTFEVIAGVLTLWRQTRPLGLMIFATIVLGAVGAHVAHSEWLELLWASVVLATALIIAWRTRYEAVSVLRMTVS